jgi:hypothetical protein
MVWNKSDDKTLKGSILLTTQGCPGRYSKPSSGSSGHTGDTRSGQRRSFRKIVVNHGEEVNCEEKLFIKNR